MTARLLLLLVIGVGTPRVATCQQLNASLLARPRTSAPANVPAGFFSEQFASGVRTGGVVGLFTFAAVLTQGALDGRAYPAIDLVDISIAMVAGLVGYSAGSAVGVYRYSKSNGVRAPWIATTLGSVVGMIVGLPLAGIGVLYTAPAGAARLHNFAHDRTAHPHP